MSWNELSLKDKADYIKESVNNGIYNLSDIRNRYNIYAEGGYIPSNKIKKDIANWEGSEMKRNVPFSEVTRQFNATIPASIRARLSSNQLNALYSYGYNVGMGNLKKRVLPTLNNYVKGKATNEDVQRSMWASRDNELRGLTRRRNWEREMFGGNYRTIFTGTGGTPNNYSYSIKSNTNTKVNPYQIQNEEWQDKNYLAAYKGLQLSMNDIMGKTKEDDIDDLFSTGTGPTISMENLLSIGNNNAAPVQPDYSYAKSLLSDFDSDLNNNIFDEGGNLNFIDADNRRSNILLHTEDGNLYDSVGNNYTQSYLDEENVPVIKGTMPRNTRQYYDPNTTLEFINAATAPISNFSPSNIVGSIREARDYNTFMNSFMNQDNTGFFTREYAKEHPYISTLGNLGGDILAGVAFDKGIDLYRLGKQAFKEELPYLSTIAKSRLYSDNPIINTYATYARRFNLPDKARLPYLIRRWKPEEIQPIINNELQINGSRLGHTNFTWDRAVISHNKGKWDKGAQTLLINPRELIARNKNNWGSIEPMDMFTITDNGNGFRVPTKDVTIISGNLNTLADAASNNIRTATSKLLQQDEKRIAKDVGESLGRFNLNRDPRRGFDSNMYNHANEIIKHFGFPKIKDVKLLEKLTGLKSYTVPFDKQKKAFIEKLKNFKNLSLNEAEELLENNSNFPNGTPINITSAESIDKRNLTKFDFNNLFYDPATMAEYLFFNPK